MDKLKVNIKTLAPVIIPITLGEVNVVQTGQHLSGSVILGLFAAEYIRRDKKPDKQPEHNTNGFHEDRNFYQWFLSGDLKYEPAYPSNPESDKPYLPCPLYLQQEKLDNKKLLNIFSPVKIETKAIQKYAYFNGNKVSLHSPPRRLFFHHRRDNRLAARSEDGGIFNYEAIEKDQYFTGYITGDSNILKNFHDCFAGTANANGTSFNARVGRSKNTQYGWVEVTIHKPEKAEIVIEGAQPDGGNPMPKSVYLTLTTPLIIYNEFGYPETTVDNLEKSLSRAMQVEKVTVNKALSRSETIENFVAVWRLKKPLDYAYKAGSSFEIALPGDKTSNAELISKLGDLGQSGLGERTHEGYGRFRLTLSFPENYELSDSKIMYKPVVSTKPAEVMPEPLKDLTYRILADHLLRLVENKAFIDAKGYTGQGRKNLPSNSLLGRLELIASGVPVAGSGQDQVSYSSAFPRMTEKLKTPAKDQLRRCWRGDQNMLDLLTKSELQEKNLGSCTLSEKEKKLAKLAGFNYEEDQELNNRLQKKYWLTLFRRMRKLNREVK
jgi:CRISPR-associated protein Csx10